MRKIITTLFVIALLSVKLSAQVEPNAGNWKTWFVESGKQYRLPAPSAYKPELSDVMEAQRNLTAADLRKIQYWNAGAPGFRWYEMINKMWMTDISGNGALANMLVGTAIYDATIAAWDSKYTHNRPRPFTADSKIKIYSPRPESPSFPCEYAVAAGAGATIIAHFYPNLADSVARMAQQVMASRVAAGVAFPSDTKAGFELGKQIALKEIERTKNFITTVKWDGQIPQGPGYWNGKSPMMPTAGLSKTAVLDSASQFRPGPPPDFTKEMEELKSFKQTFRSSANAFHYASQPIGSDLLIRKLFEYNLHNNPPRAARIVAAVNISYYDAFTACWDAKYAYWGIRPDQFDPTYKPLIPTPPFPGYPSGHAVMSGVVGELFSYFFPTERALFEKIAREGAESRFQAGIHFRTDNNVGLDLGKKVAGKVADRLRADGSENDPMVALVTGNKK